jgi:type II secretory ATPase GspE/PulE/Tfp pilus assembly ATPase PilB-like protein
MTPAEILGSSQIFSSLPAGHIEQIAARLEPRQVAKGEDLVVQGQPGDALFVIEAGRFGVFVRDPDFGLAIEVAQLGPGDCLGELALVTGETRSATCTALMDSTVHRLDRAVFDAILAQAPQVQRDLMKVLAARLAATGARQGVPFVSLARFEPDPQLAALIPEQIVRRRGVVPVAFENGAVTLAAVDPADSGGIEEVRRYLRGVRVRPVAASREEVDRFIDRLGLGAPKAGAKIADQPIRFIAEAEEAERTTRAGGPDVLELVNRIILTGVAGGASDIHVEPGREGIRVRYRINGSLEERIGPLPLEAHKPLLSRFKILARLDITETRKPQEGRISLEVGGRPVDLRLSLVPTKLGQKLVLRVLDASAALVPLEKIVLAEKVRQSVRKMFYAPHGVVLVTGPTGSGKTTTLYSGLLERRNPEISIVTVEDPVEFHLDGLSQVEIGQIPGVDFSTVLRSFLRQDPDIILVGETRDAETAKLALQAGLAGRLVLTSFHTNSCIAALVRLFEMGMEPFALSGSLVGVIHQRLIGRLCPECRAPFEYYPQIIDNLRHAQVIGAQVPTLYRSKGCARCREQGYVGRVAALEILVLNDEVRSAVARQAAPEEILEVAARSGAFVPLHRYLGFLIQHGITTPGEALSVLPRRSA